MQSVSRKAWSNLHLLGRMSVGGLALLGTTAVTDILNTWIAGYEQAVDAVVIILSVSLVWLYIAAPALAELYPAKGQR